MFRILALPKERAYGEACARERCRTGSFRLQRLPHTIPDAGARTAEDGSPDPTLIRPAHEDPSLPAAILPQSDRALVGSAAWHRFFVLLAVA